MSHPINGGSVTKFRGRMPGVGDGPVVYYRLERTRRRIPISKMTPDQWNDRHPVGTRVRFWPASRGGPGVYGRTVKPADYYGGAVCVAVDAGAGPRTIGLAYLHPVGEAD